MQRRQRPAALHALFHRKEEVDRRRQQQHLIDGALAALHQLEKPRASTDPRQVTTTRPAPTAAMPAMPAAASARSGQIGLLNPSMCCCVPPASSRSSWHTSARPEPGNRAVMRRSRRPMVSTIRDASSSARCCLPARRGHGPPDHRLTTND